MVADHIVKAYDEELKRLTTTVVQMGGLAEAQLQQAIQAVIRRDTDLAGTIIVQDAQIDEVEHEISGFVVRLLALRQPVATDLRVIISALKIASDLERIGDYATNIAKRCIALNQIPPVPPVNSVPRLAMLARNVLRHTLDAYIAQDADKAMEVWRRDEAVDEAYTGLFRELLTYMIEDPRNITPCTHLLFIAKNIERIGDHATNIAETIIYMVKGRPPQEARPKSDTTSIFIDPGEG